MGDSDLGRTRRGWPGWLPGRGDKEAERGTDPQHMRGRLGTRGRAGPVGRVWHGPDAKPVAASVESSRRPEEGWVTRHLLVLWTGHRLDVAEMHASSPQGRRHEIEVVQVRSHEVACLVVDHRDRVLLALRYGYGTERTGWELPTTTVRDGEPVLSAAERVVQDRCGWTVHSPRLDGGLARWPECCNIETRIVSARARQQVRPPDDEAHDVTWFGRSQVRSMLDTAGFVEDAITAAVLYHWLTQGAFV